MAAATERASGGEGKTTAGDSPVSGGTNTPSSGGANDGSIRPARQKRSLRESPLKANSANSACLNQG